MSGSRDKNRARKRGTRNNHWWVDASPRNDGTTQWALIGPTLELERTGTVPTLNKPHVDSTFGEASAVLEALMHVPENATLFTDSLSLVRSVRNPKGRHHIGGRAGEVADRARTRSVRLAWARRTRPGMLNAHRAATRSKKGEKR